MGIKNKKLLTRHRRHRRVRKKVFGTSERPRVAVYKSLRQIYVQIIDDTKGITLLSASTLNKELKDKVKNKSKTEQAKEVGVYLGKLAKKEGIKKLSFDRGGFKYHGRIKALAEGIRESGIEV